MWRLLSRKVPRGSSALQAAFRGSNEILRTPNTLRRKQDQLAGHIPVASFEASARRVVILPHQISMITPIVRESEWRERLQNLPQWHPPRTPTLIIAPHPDDETLGAGGLIAALRDGGIEIIVVAVTDGEHAYGETPGMAALREEEQTLALSQLGVDFQHIHRLRLPDRSVAAHEEALVGALLQLVCSDVHIVAPWPGDFHPDHEACGRAAEIVARRKHLQLTWYMFWAWHRGTLQLLDGLALTSFPLSKTELETKCRALRCHQSQLRHPSGDPILPENLLGPVNRPFEVFLPSRTEYCP